VRAVTHYGIERADVEEALRTMRRVVTGHRYSVPPLRGS
jgi:hypothetical protein